MPADPRRPVILLWHMHQPDYRFGGRAALPWVYFRALREYSDMAAHLEAVPGARATINFSPVLLDQLDELAGQLRALQQGGDSGGAPDIAAALLRLPTEARRTAVLLDCLRTDRLNGRGRYPVYEALCVEAEQALAAGDAAVAAMPAGLVTDLVVWTHLVWLPESLRGEDAQLRRLLSRQRGFDHADCRELLGVVSGLVQQLLPRYRRLAAEGRIELSTSPYFHPLLPLLVDVHSAREAAPAIELPSTPYPGGMERARAQLETARQRFAEVFGCEPRGCWPSEAAISEDVLALLQSSGFTWAMSSDSLLRRTNPEPPHPLPVRAARLAGGALTCLFRDDELSDRIGFIYRDRRPAEAVADLVGAIEQRTASGIGPVVIALDGENAWQYYPHNGIEFLRGLYRALADHPQLRMTTPSAFLDDLQAPLPTLQRVVAGSWADGCLRTWIGDPAKNRLWELLIAAKRRYDALPAATAAARYQLGACEGSDWFWWPGNAAAAGSAAEFEWLFQRRLDELTRACEAGSTPPP